MNRRETSKEIASTSASELVLSNMTDVGAYDTKLGAYDPITTRPSRSYTEFDRAYAFFNDGLFDGALPPCLITLQRSGRAHGYFSPDRFINIDNPSEVANEIGMNPIHFGTQLTINVLATLVHEMAHVWQHVAGSPSRGGYHNKEWARKMVEIGLIPSSTGALGGKSTGERMSHYVRQGGRFEVVCAAYLANDTVTLFQDAAYREVRGDEGQVGGERVGRAARLEKADRERARKARSKTRFTCPRCKENAWAKQGRKLLCGNEKCDQEGMEPGGPRADGAGTFDSEVEEETE